MTYLDPLLDRLATGAFGKEASPRRLPMRT
jgi:hypothetical protein